MFVRLRNDLQNKSNLKMFLYKNQFLMIFSFLSVPILLCESTAAIFRQSAGYVFVFQRYFCNVRSRNQFGDPSKPNREFYLAFIVLFCNLVFKNMMAPCSSSAFCLQLRN